MKTITVKEFKAEIKRDVEWAAKLKTPIQIKGYCNMKRSRIQSLSPLLHFLGSKNHSVCATFASCKNLKIAAGRFDGRVDFSKSGIEKIGKLKIKVYQWSDAANFSNCKHLKIAEGSFPSYVDFSHSGIESIRRLHIKDVNEEGTAANFSGCKNLKVAQGHFPGAVSFSKSGIKKIRSLHINPLDYSKRAKFVSYTNVCDGELVEELKDRYRRADIADFSQCLALERAEGTFPGSVNFSDSGVKRIHKLYVPGSPGYNGNASFFDCPRLKIAAGTFSGHVDFSYSSVERIGNLAHEGEYSGDWATFYECRNLKWVHKKWLNPGIYLDSALVKRMWGKNAMQESGKLSEELQEL